MPAAAARNMPAAEPDRMTDAERQALRRERQRAGRICVTVDVDEVQALAVLCSFGILDEREECDRVDIGEAISELVERLNRDL